MVKAPNLDDMYTEVDREQIKKAFMMIVNQAMSNSPHPHITKKAVRLAVQDINKIYNPEVNVDDYMVK